MTVNSTFKVAVQSNFDGSGNYSSVALYFGKLQNGNCVVLLNNSVAYSATNNTNIGFLLGCVITGYTLNITMLNTKTNISLNCIYPTAGLTQGTVNKNGTLSGCV